MDTMDWYAEAFDQWGSNSWYTYLVVEEDTPMGSFSLELADLDRRHQSRMSYYNGVPETLATFYVQPLTDIHLRSHINFELGPNGDIRYVYLFSLVGLIILLTASVNYMNLATARASARAREIGIRKVAGANQSQLASQFIAEALLVTVVAGTAAAVVALTLLPPFRALVDRDIPPEMLTDWVAIGFGTGITLAIGVLSGIYPALALPRSRPAVILGGSSSGRGRSPFRNALVVVQFSAGVALIAGTAVIQDQLRFMMSAETGVTMSQVLALRTTDETLGDRYEALEASLLSQAGVGSVTSSVYLPTDIRTRYGVPDWEGRGGGLDFSVYSSPINYGWVEMAGLELVEGRSFSHDYDGDEGVGLIINETARETLGWDTAIGKYLDLGRRGQRVVGVVKDFNFHSLRQPMAPLALSLDTHRADRVLIRVDSLGVPATLARIEQVMQSLSPGHPVSWIFLDDAFSEMYRTEERLGLIMSVFAGIAIVVACLGLFGLSAFVAGRRTREIGVRKMLGASTGNIVLLLSREFGNLVALAILIGSPIAYAVMIPWLDGFAYHAPLGWSTFAVAGGGAMVLALATVSYQAIKVSMTVPARSLAAE
jgi:putative ABC transport system permease protein